MTHLNSKVEARKGMIINFLFFGMFIALYYCFVKYAFWYFFPFIVAVLVGVLLQKPIRGISRKLRIKKHSAVAFVLVTLLCLLTGIVLTIAGILLVNELKSFLSYLGSRLSNTTEYIKSVETWLLGVLEYLPDTIQEVVQSTISDFFSKLYGAEGAATDVPSFDFSMLSAPLTGAWSAAKRIPSLVLSLVVTIIACFFITADYNRISAFILNFVPEHSRKRAINIKRSFFSAFGKMVKAYSLIMTITFVEMFLGLNLLSLFGLYSSGYIIVISLVTAVVDIIPVLGTGTILLPWAVISLFTGKIGLGIGLLVLYGVVTVLRQIIEPKLVAGQVGLPAIFTIMAMFIGSKVFGVFGIVILPLTVVAVKLMYDEGLFLPEEELAKRLDEKDKAKALASESDDSPPKSKKTFKDILKKVGIKKK